MNPRYEIVEARPFHCGQMARALRREHRELLARVGADAHRELRACFDQSSFRRAWLIDGRLAALGGLTGSMLSGDGMLWLALSDEATRHPFAVVREARKQLDEMMRVKRVLSAGVMGGDDAAARLAVFLCFTAAGSTFLGPAFSKAGRRLLERELKCNADLRIPVGAAFLTPMRYSLSETA